MRGRNRVSARATGLARQPGLCRTGSYIKHYIYKNLYTYIKNVLTNFLWILNFGLVGDPDAKIQKQPLGWIFFKSY